MVTGGGRSGKSVYAENLLREKKEVLYIATTVPFDEDMQNRVKIHANRRPSNWKTIEKYKDFSRTIVDRSDENDGILVDCVTVMINNLIFDTGADFDMISLDEYAKIESTIFNEIDELLLLIRTSNRTAVIVTNEVGLGIIPENRLARLYRDTAGKVNCKIADCSDEVWLVVSGIPVKIK